MREITLTQGKFAQVDDEDYEKVSKFRWCAEKLGHVFYAKRWVTIDGKAVGIRMHRLIVSLERGDSRLVDHKDGNGLNNQKSNLRICTKAQNQFNMRRNSRNTSGYRGVSRGKKPGTWCARIRSSGKYLYLGSYHSKEDAYVAYCKAAKELRGEYAGV